jgi:hypothetical protein
VAPAANDRRSATQVHIGTGQPTSLSPDGRWAVASPVDGRSLILNPTGPGESRTLPNPEDLRFDNAGWLDATHLIMFGQKAGERSQGYIQDIDNDPPRRFTPGGATAKAARWWTLPISADGTRVVATDEHDRTLIYPVNGDAPRPVPNLNATDVVVQ